MDEDISRNSSRYLVLTKLPRPRSRDGSFRTGYSRYLLKTEPRNFSTESSLEEEDQVLLVDVGAGRGQVLRDGLCQSVRTLWDGMIAQDLPEVMAGPARSARSGEI